MPLLFVNPENVIVPLDVIPVAAAIAPDELTWNRSPDPTDRSAAGVSSPIPTLPFASTVSPEPDVEFDWNLASIPVVVAVEFAT
jgi:hypothetical protein